MHIYTHYRSGFLGYVLPNWRDDYYANPSYQNIHLSLPELEDQVSCQPSSWAKRGGAPAVNAAVFFSNAGSPWIIRLSDSLILQIYRKLDE